MEPTRPSMSTNALVYMLMFIIIVLIVMVTIILHKAYKFKQLNEYHQNMVRQVRAILKEEGDLQDRLHQSHLRARREE